MIDGFIPGSRASFILDFVGVAMIIISVLLVISAYLVHTKRNFKAHRNIQMSVAIILSLAVLVFEIDMRINGWMHMAKASVYYDSYVFPALYIHILISVFAIVVWSTLIYRGLKNFPKPLTSPGAHGNFHRKWGRIGMLAMFGTTVSGGIFYYLAFVA